jgi:hypothetical protein
VGVDKKKDHLLPLPFIPSHRGEGRFSENIQRKLAINSQTVLCQNLKHILPLISPWSSVLILIIER